ncbi:MAG: hypothetical protein KY453_03340 [Gemmatimonadetes bacterium]|nr:hypothetical protein [Gemmatimonadota bacterium]
MVFSSDRDGTSRVYVRAAADSAWRPLSPRDYSGSWPAPSADGGLVLFQAVRNGAFDVHAVETTGSAPERLTDTPSHEYLPSWAPDGRVTFASSGLVAGDTMPDVWIWIMEADGTEQRRLVPEGLGTSAAATWAPDGSHFLTSRGVEGSTSLWRVSPEGRWIEPVGDSLSAPDFSPDGTWIAAYVEGATGSRIDILRADGSERRTLLDGGWHWYPRWSPDGRWILTCSAVDEEHADLDVLLVPIDGSAPPETLVGGPDRECEASWMAER